MQSNIELLFGKGKLEVCLPHSIAPTIIRKPPMPVIEDPSVAVAQAFNNPVGLDNFKSACAGTESACIVICDITRPVPNHLFLKPLIDLMLANGIQQERITILVATGLHRPNLGDELKELIGDEWVFENIKIINHDARCDDDHIDLGKTPTRGTPVKINKHFIEADLRVVTGLVEPHFMAGYSGGRKIIAPGVAHVDTITTFHNHRFMSDPSADNCNLLNNPLHEEQLEIVKLVGGALAINTVIDEDRSLSMINFGEVVESHQQAVGFIQDFCQVKLDSPFDVVITSAAGYPLDKTFYQTVKGMVGAIGILKPGGDLVIVSECGEGIGSEEYIDAQQRLIELGMHQFLQSLSVKMFADIDEWQTQMQTKAMSLGNIFLHSKLDSKFDHLTGVQRLNDLQEFLNKIDVNKSVAVIPEGPYVIPTLKNS